MATNLVPFEGDIRLIWDASSLTALMKNPYTYYQWYVKNRYLVGDERTAANWGTAWHSVIETYWTEKGKEPDLRDDILVGYAWYRNHELISKMQPTGALSAFSLLRALVWYHAWENHRPEKLCETTVDIEQPFRYKIQGVTSPRGAPYYLGGHVDQVIEKDGGVWIVERKTGAAMLTANQVVRRYLFQLHCYMYHGANKYKERFRGVVVDAVQTAVTFNDFARFELPIESCNYDEDHFLSVVRWRIRFAEQLALANTWKQAARIDDPFAPRQIADMLNAPPKLWDRLFQAATAERAPWIPGEPKCY